MFTAADSWDKFFPRTQNRPARVMFEEAMVRNCLHMLLGLTTDLFRTTPEHVVYINSEFFNTCKCPHLSPNAMKNIIKEIARVSTHVNILRVTVNKHRLLHGDASDVIARHGRHLLDHIDSWTRMEINKQGLTLIQLCRHLRSNLRDVGAFLSFVDAFESDKSFDDLRSMHFCLGNFSQITLIVQNHLKSIIRNSNVNDDATQVIHGEDLLFPSYCNKRIDHSAFDIKRELSDEPEKTFFICYIHSNRILSY